MKFETIKPILEKFEECKKENGSEEKLREIFWNELVPHFNSAEFFPVPTLTQLEIEKEFKQISQASYSWDGDVLRAFSKAGLKITTILNPSYFTTTVKKNTIYDALTKKQELIFKTFLTKYNVSSFGNFRALIGLASSCPVASFQPVRARAIYETFAPENAVIYDPSFGWGGRMLGALAASNVKTYIGTDPSTAAFKGIKEISERVAEHHNKEVVLFNLGSEVLKLESEIVDLAFTSPPYFDLEIYSDEPTQSTNCFKSKEDWLEGFFRKTAENVLEGLKPGGIYIINVNDSKSVKVQELQDLIQSIDGFEFEKLKCFKTPTRPGAFQKPDKENIKEKLLIFRKETLRRNKAQDVGSS